MAVQIPLSDTARAPETTEHGIYEVAPDIAYLRTLLVNVVVVGRPEGEWVLVDAGLHGSHHAIVHAAAERFGPRRPPVAIVMTHAHFDHVGNLEQLAAEWDVPVFAHPLEAPYLTGAASYPPPDTHAEGGIMPKLAPLFPRSPVDVGARLETLPADGTVPPLPGWRWLHTPGHTEGHVSFWREADRTLIAGDAVITTGQESAYEVATQAPEMHGPPRYFTPDWAAAERSARQLAALEPELIVTGHGRAMSGPEMRAALHQLADDFEHIAVPRSAKEP